MLLRQGPAEAAFDAGSRPGMGLLDFAIGQILLDFGSRAI